MTTVPLDTDSLLAEAGDADLGGLPDGTTAVWFGRAKQSGDWMLEQAVHEFNLIWSAVRVHPLKAYAVGRTGIIPGRDTTTRPPRRGPGRAPGAGTRVARP